MIRDESFAARSRDLHEQTFIGRYCVSTVSLSVEHHGGMWYETYIFPANGEEITGWLEVWSVRYATRDEAAAGHEQVCADLRAGKLKTWEDEVLDALTDLERKRLRYGLERRKADAARIRP